MILATHGIVGSSIVQFTPLLDDYSGAAAAYSLRLLRSAYTGDAIKVRRAVGTPAETYIGFVNNELDVATLESFCSGTDGYVVTWYDQSGNGRDATQSTAISQPQIVSSGSVITENGKPAVDFDGSDDYLTFSNFDFATGISAFNTYSLNSLPITSSFWHSYFVKNTAGTNVFGLEFSGNTSYDTKGAIIGNKAVPNDAITANTNQHLNTNIYDGSGTSQTDVIMFEDGLSLTLTSVQNWNAIKGGSAIGWWTAGGATQYYHGKHQELVLYDSDQSSNRTGIETNINDFYSIY